MNKSPEPDNIAGLLSTQQAAKVLGISRMTVLARISRGQLPAHKVSEIWLIEQAEVEKALAHPPKRGRPRKASPTASDKPSEKSRR